MHYCLWDGCFVKSEPRSVPSQCTDSNNNVDLLKHHKNSSVNIYIYKICKIGAAGNFSSDVWFFLTKCTCYFQGAQCIYIQFSIHLALLVSVTGYRILTCFVRKFSCNIDIVLIIWFFIKRYSPSKLVVISSRISNVYTFVMTQLCFNEMVTAN